jgi:hypothetical protein
MLCCARRDLTRLGLWTPALKNELVAANGSVQELPIPEDLKALYKTVWEIKQRTLVDMAAARGAYIDQSQVRRTCTRAVLRCSMCPCTILALRTSLCELVSLPDPPYSRTRNRCSMCFCCMHVLHKRMPIAIRK